MIVLFIILYEMKKILLLVAIVSISSFCISCGNDNPAPSPSEEDAGFVHSVNVGDNTYISLFKDLIVGEVNTDKAQIFAKVSFTYVYKAKVYVTDT